jgi:predicted SAM-dependent methyltransferase
MNEIDRNNIMLQHILKTDIGLEIGPSYNPIVPKKDGWNVLICDHASKQELQSKYEKWGVDVSKVEEVDFIVDHRGLGKCINKTSHFKYIIASHVIEHTVSIITFLQECTSMLVEGGLLILAIPDKRRCFDFIKPLTTTGQAIDAFHRNNGFHSPGVIFDSYNLMVNKNNQILWHNDIENEIRVHHSFKETIDAYTNSLEYSEYIDVHSWKFTPDSFKLIIDDLCRIGLISLQLKCIHDTVGFEFFVVLKKSKNIEFLEEEERKKILLNVYSCNTY